MLYKFFFSVLQLYQTYALCDIEQTVWLCVAYSIFPHCSFRIKHDKESEILDNRGSKADFRFL